MININQIKPDMPVVCSQNDPFAIVDHMEGEQFIKLNKDQQGQHHYIPVSWVNSTDDGKVKLNRSGERAMQQWTTTSPSSARL